MKELIKKYKPVLKFILTFLFVYSMLIMAYKFYLDNSHDSKFYPDYVTNLVARQTQSLIEASGYKAQISPHPNEASMKLFINNKFVARIIEGCNSISIIILFVSFIIAYAGKFKTTFFYLIFGCVLIYIVNLMRIVILTVGLYHYPWRREILHSVIFPLIIYGLMFLLWMFWVNRFVNLKAKNE